MDNPRHETVQKSGVRSSLRNTYSRESEFRISYIVALFVLCIFIYIEPQHHSRNSSVSDTSSVWSHYAYSQYATDQHYLCNSLMVFDQLEKLGSRADRVLFYPKVWDLDVSSSKDRTSQLLVMARDDYKVKLKPVDIWKLNRSTTDADDEADTTWDASVNKLYAFGLIEYDRVVHLDSDLTLLKNIDELFLMPLKSVAMAQAYWKIREGVRELTSLVVVAKPDEAEFEALWERATGMASDSAQIDSTALFDMELLNNRYGHNATILPHQEYALITGELRRSENDHRDFLGNESARWSVDDVLHHAKLVHFSDWPLPKPWIMWPLELHRQLRPACSTAPGTPSESGCENRRVWESLYDDFRRRRKDVCKLLSVPAPDWPPKQRSSSKVGQ